MDATDSSLHAAQCAVEALGRELDLNGATDNLVIKFRELEVRRTMALLAGDATSAAYWQSQIDAMPHRQPTSTSLDAAIAALPPNTGYVLYHPLGKTPSAAIQTQDEGWGEHAFGPSVADALRAAQPPAAGQAAPDGSPAGERPLLLSLSEIDDLIWAVNETKSLNPDPRRSLLAKLEDHRTKLDQA